jgi:hypothetical protein
MAAMTDEGEAFRLLHTNVVVVNRRANVLRPGGLPRLTAMVLLLVQGVRRVRRLA